LVKNEAKRLVVLCEGRLFYDGGVQLFFEDSQNMEKTGIFEIF
jgi:hypothetical protein